MGKNRRSRNRKRLAKAIRRNKKQILFAGLGVILLIAVLVIVGVCLRGCSEAQKEADVIMEDEQAAGEAVSEPDSDSIVPEESTEILLENAWPEVNELVARYFTALQSGDGDTLIQLRDNTEAKELLRMQLNGEYIEAYKNLKCYTKSGLTADSYVVYAYYEVKFTGHDTLLPGLTPLYICRNEEGNLYLHDLTGNDEIVLHVSEVTSHDDVADLYALVGTEYQNILSQNENLKAFVAEYAEKLKTAVGEALEEEPAEDGTDQEEAGQEGDSPENGDSSAVPASGKFKVGDTLNVRKSPSEDAERIGVCYEGETIEILEKQADGWTKVKFNGETGYIKTSVLK